MASTTTDWIGASAAAVAALGTIILGVLGVVIARRQGGIQESQLAISERLKEMEERRYAESRRPRLLIERTGEGEDPFDSELSLAEDITVVVRNAGGGPALRIRAYVAVFKDGIECLVSLPFHRELMMPSEGATVSIPMSGHEESMGLVVLTGSCQDIDGNRVELRR